MHRFWENFRVWRKKQKARLPFIGRRRYERALAALDRLRRKNAELAKLLVAYSGALASDANIVETIPIRPAETDELCLFVTHAPTPTLKQHVVEHIGSMLGENIAVVLIVNTDHQASDFMLAPDFASRLAGLLVRQNVGFDFAAWGHAFSLLPHGMVRRRLYFVNDSIVGPLDMSAYRKILERIRRSSADMIGLTQNLKPTPHLQSFYLAFSKRLFASPLFAGVMKNLLNLPSKEVVIDVYETQLTGYFEEHGFQCEVLFPNMAEDGRADDAFFRWARLIENGFPFIKASILHKTALSADIVRLVPHRYR